MRVQSFACETFSSQSKEKLNIIADLQNYLVSIGWVSESNRTLEFRMRNSYSSRTEETFVFFIRVWNIKLSMVGCRRDNYPGA